MILLMAVGGGVTPPPVDPRPVVDDPLVMAMRPAAKPLATLRIADGIGGDFTTFGEAITEGNAIQAAAVSAASLRPEQITPNFRIDYLTDVGTYDVTGPLAPCSRRSTRPGRKARPW